MSKSKTSLFKIEEVNTETCKIIILGDKETQGAALGIAQITWHKVSENEHKT